MSEQLIQKLLDIGGCGAETEWAQGYDDGVNAAIDEVERYFKQPSLNENQLEVLEWLKDYVSRESVTPVDTVGVFWKERNFRGQPSNWRMNSREQAQVLQAFSQWVMEQEEE